MELSDSVWGGRPRPPLQPFENPTRDDSPRLALSFPTDGRQPYLAFYFEEFPCDAYSPF